MDYSPQHTVADKSTPDRSERFDYRLRIQVPEDSTEAILLRYLMENKNPIYSHKEMALLAFKACWLPYACEQAIQRGDTGLSEEELKRIAADAFDYLQERIESVRRRFLAPTIDPPPFKIEP
jgi:hypothetical protein